MRPPEPRPLFLWPTYRYLCTDQGLMALGCWGLGLLWVFDLLPAPRETSPLELYLGPRYAQITVTVVVFSLALLGTLNLYGLVQQQRWSLTTILIQEGILLTLLVIALAMIETSLWLFLLFLLRITMTVNLLLLRKSRPFQAPISHRKRQSGSSF